LLNFLYTPVSWVLLQWHHFWNFVGLPATGGINWALSIVFLVITIRLLLFRVFIKQIKYQRKMATLQPKIAKIREKHKNDRAAMQQEMMKLQQEEGFNPLAGCLPLLVQAPIFIALYHTLRHLANSVVHCGPDGKPLEPVSKYLQMYTFTPTETCNAAQARLFGDAPLAAKLFEPTEQLRLLGGERGVTVAVIVVLVLISAAATFLTQVFARRANPVKPEGQAAMIAGIMLYLIPVGTLGSGLFFPLGVLLYWFTSNTWTLAQQLYANKYHPHEETKKPPTGELGKTLAPKVGQRPTKANLTKQSAADTGSEVDPSPDEPAPRTSTPRPGQRPTRPRGTSKGPANRKSQAKKRR
jgi:YidC/Oxa1 family membrane protein insertase